MIKNNEKNNIYWWENSQEIGICYTMSFGIPLLNYLSTHAGVCKLKK